MKLTILGASLSGLSLAYFLRDRSDIEHIDIIEKDDDIAGCKRQWKSLSLRSTFIIAFTHKWRDKRICETVL